MIERGEKTDGHMLDVNVDGRRAMRFRKPVELLEPVGFACHLSRVFSDGRRSPQIFEEAVPSRWPTKKSAANLVILLGGQSAVCDTNIDTAVG